MARKATYRCNVKAGIIYFPIPALAEDYRKAWTTGHWAVYRNTSRVVAYGLGYAIQTQVSGDYFGPNGVPTMQDRLNRM